MLDERRPDGVAGALGGQARGDERTQLAAGDRVVAVEGNLSPHIGDADAENGGAGGRRRQRAGGGGQLQLGRQRRGRLRGRGGRRGERWIIGIDIPRIGENDRV